jgi:hypothetical protein
MTQWATPEPPEGVKRTGGNFDRVAGLYFAATAVEKVFLVERGVCQDFLLALNFTGTSIKGGRLRNTERFDRFLEGVEGRGGRLYIDCGAFSFVSNLAAQRNVDPQVLFVDNSITTTEEARHHREHYRAFLDRYASRVWGFVEVDIGSVDRRCEIREVFEDWGHTPIPAFRALFDPWEYLDELIDSYDRVCFAGLLRSSNSLRGKLMTEAALRFKQRPYCYVHSLGMAPTTQITSLGFHSCDSTSYLDLARFCCCQKLAVGGLLPYREPALSRDIAAAARYLGKASPLMSHSLGGIRYNGYNEARNHVVNFQRGVLGMP